MEKKKSSMQKEVEKSEVPVGAQMPLIDVSPEHSEEIVKVARAYYAKVKARKEIQEGRGGEYELQERLLALVKAENLTRDGNGKIKFTVDSVELELVPMKEKVKVKIVDE